MAKHVVVDGSNIATEGRTVPSLKQLNEAVMSFMSEFPDAKVTVVVDASFGHRIDKKEVKDFNDAINNNELVSPPAGAVGRGDGFVLTIAEKVGASILSNDSYQEFHHQYKWLFDPGRLLGGKPVPLVGWVFIERLPVRTSAGRESTSAVRKSGPRRVAKARVENQRPMPIPKSPPPGPRVVAKAKLAVTAVTAVTAKHQPRTAVAKHQARKAVAKQASTTASSTTASSTTASSSAQTNAVNELAPFIEFVEKHPVGRKVKGTVETYSAHGVYVRIGDVSCYLPLRLMADPAPRSAREFVKIGQQLSLTVAGFTPARRSIEVGIIGVTPEPVAKKTKKRAAVAPSRKPAARKK
jgi:hypothetical protein